MIAEISTRRPPSREAVWATFALLTALLLMPDCCLIGRHVHGLGMAAFGPICHAPR